MNFSPVREVFALRLASLVSYGSKMNSHWLGVQRQNRFQLGQMGSDGAQQREGRKRGPSFWKGSAEVSLRRARVPTPPSAILCKASETIRTWARSPVEFPEPVHKKATTPERR